MKFSCNQDTFSKYLNTLSRVVQSKPGLPILNNILFEVSKNKVSMTATDLEVSLNCWIGAEVMDDGKITIPAKQLSEFVNSIPKEKIDVILENNTIHLETKNNSAKFNTIVADDYPEVPSIGKGLKPILKIKKDDILKAINRVVFAAANNDIKPVLTGVLIEVEEKSINFVATDGFRLSKQILELEKKSEEKLKLLVPSKALEELSKIIVEFSSEEDDDFVEIYQIEKKNQVIFKCNDIELVSRLIDGEFPEYTQIIPTGFQTKTTFKRGDFLNSLKVVNIIARNILGNKIELDIKSEENKTILSAAQSDIGSNKSEFKIKCEGEDLQIAFSGKLVSDILNNIDDDELTFECISAVSPGVFKLKKDPSFIHLIMPMRI